MREHKEILEKEERLWIELDEPLPQSAFNETLERYNKTADELEMIENQPDEYMSIFGGLINEPLLIE